MKYVVFDFDGTLVDSKALFVSIYNELAQKKGYRLMTSDVIEHLRDMSIPERCKFLKVPMYRIPFLVTAFLKMYREDIALLKLNNGIKEMLEEFSYSGIQYAIISTNSKETIEEFLKLKNITGFDDIFCSKSIFGKHKLLTKFLKSKKMSPDNIIYVGDEARDIEACRKVGVEVAWVSWGYDSFNAIERLKPKYILNHPSELFMLVSALKKNAL